MLGPTYYADLNLKSPAGPDNPPHRYIWTGCGKDIHDTINLIRRDIPDLNDAMNVPRMLHLDTTSYESMTWLCQFYNAAIDTVLILVSSTFILLILINFLAKNVNWCNDYRKAALTYTIV